MTQEQPLDKINDFIDRLIEEKELTGLDDQILSQLKKDLRERIENKVNASILDAIPVEHIEEFEKVLTNSSAQEVQEYCARVIPDLDQVIAQALIDFRKKYLNL